MKWKMKIGTAINILRMTMNLMTITSKDKQNIPRLIKSFHRYPKTLTKNIMSHPLVKDQFIHKYNKFNNGMEKINSKEGQM